MKNNTPKNDILERKWLNAVRAFEKAKNNTKITYDSYVYFGNLLLELKSLYVHGYFKRALKDWFPDENYRTLALYMYIAKNANKLELYSKTFGIELSLKVARELLIKEAKEKTSLTPELRISVTGYTFEKENTEKSTTYECKKDTLENTPISAEFFYQNNEIEPSEQSQTKETKHPGFGFDIQKSVVLTKELEEKRQEKEMKEEARKLQEKEDRIIKKLNGLVKLLMKLPDNEIEEIFEEMYVSIEKRIKKS